MTRPQEVSRRHFLRMAGAAGVAVGATSASGSLLAACSRGGDNDTLKVGVMAPFSGVGQFIGDVVDSSLTAAVKHINSTGGVSGRKVELVIRDTGADRGLSDRVYGELASMQDLLGILWCGAVGFYETLPRIRDDGVPLIAVFEDPFSLGQLYPAQGSGRSVFQVSVPDSAVKEALGDYARNDRGYSSAALLYDRQLEGVLDPTGASRSHFERAFSGAGLEIKGVETFSTGDEEYQAQLDRLRTASPQVLYLDGLSDETAAITMALAAMGAGYVDTPTAKGPGWHPHVFGSYRGINHLWASVAAEDARVGSVSAWHLGGVTFLPSFAIRGWMQRYVGKQPVGGEELPANGLSALLHGLEKAGTADRERVVRGIESMGKVNFASVDFGFSPSRHHALSRDDIVILTLERLRGAAETDPPYELGKEWKEDTAFSSRGASPTLLVRPSLAANRRTAPDVMSQIVEQGYGTRCTMQADGSLSPQCKIH